MPANRQRSLGRQIVASTGIVMATIIGSRFLGLLRNWVLAHVIGANGHTDAYFAAFTLPNFLNYLVAGGALSLTFIPVFTKYVAEGREEEGWDVFSTVTTFMGLLLVVLVIGAEIFAHPLVAVIAPGFHGSQRDLLVFLTRVMLPAQICFYVGGILAAVQYVRGQFLIPSVTGIIYNVGIILGGLLLAPHIGIVGFSIGVVAGALVGNLLLQIWGARRAGAHYRPRLNLRHPGFRLFIKLTIPIMLALSLPLTDDWIIRWFGSFLQKGAISWLSYAELLMRVPLGIVGQAIGVASFPVLAQLYSEKRYGELNRLLNHALKALLLLLVPIAALTIVQSSPLVHLAIGMDTRMNPFDLRATAEALIFFGLGLAAWGAQVLLARGFYATRDTLTPAIAGTALTALTLPLYWWLSHRMEFRGLALASSIGITAYSLVLFVLLIRKTRNEQVGELVRFFLKVCGISIVMAAVCYPVLERLGQWMPWHTIGGAFVDLIIVTAIGCGVLIALGRLFRLHELDEYLRELWQMVKGRLGRVAATGPQE